MNMEKRCILETAAIAKIEGTLLVRISVHSYLAQVVTSIVR